VFTLYLPSRNARELLVIELTRLEYVPGCICHSRTFCRSPASTSVIRRLFCTSLEPAFTLRLSTVYLYCFVDHSQSAPAKASPAGPPPTITTSRSSAPQSVVISLCCKCDLVLRTTCRNMEERDERRPNVWRDEYIREFGNSAAQPCSLLHRTGTYTTGKRDVQSHSRNTTGRRVQLPPGCLSSLPGFRWLCFRPEDREGLSPMWSWARPLPLASGQRADSPVGPRNLVVVTHDNVSQLGHRLAVHP
jgi:hypothetical protein